MALPFAKLIPGEEAVETGVKIAVPKAVTKEERDLQIALNEKKRTKALKLNQLKKEKELTEVINTRPEGMSVYNTLREMVGKRAGKGNTFSNIEARATAIYTRMGAGMTDVKDTLRTKKAGLSQNLEMGHEIIRYLKDGVVKNLEMEADVKRLAEQWKTTSEKLKTLRNDAGGQIGKLEDWVIPQSHNKDAIKKVGKEAWKKSIKPLLDVKRIEEQSGGKIDDILDSSYKNITARESINDNFTSVVAKRHEESRVLHFKDGDSIIRYNEQFGNSDVFGTMDNHVRMHSQEIAAMQIFGANPDANFNKMVDLARAEGMGDFQAGKLQALYNLGLGKVDGDNILDTTDKVIATIGGGHRVLQVASKLGSAAISAIADGANIMTGAGYRGLNGFKILGTGLETLAKEALSGGTASENILFASRLGLVSEFANASLANSRFAEATQTGTLAKTSEAVIRASGLGAWTHSMRASFGLELNSKIFNDFGTKFDDLTYKDMLEEYGITAAEWDAIRTTKSRTISSDSFSSDFMDIEEVYKIDEGLGYKVSEMFNTEMDAFVIMPTNRTRVWTTAGAKKGTLKGEMARNIMLFKSFPVALTQMHLARWSKLTGKGKMAYSAGVFTSSVVFGGLALMAYDTVTGKTVRSTDRVEFVWEAMMKGGGMGIFGDLFSLAENRYGHSWAGTLIGVPFGTGEDISKTLGDLAKEIKGEDVNVMANAYNRAKKYIPGQNLWYTRTLFSETLGDYLQEAIDPDFWKKERRKQKYMRQRDQEYLFNL